MLNADYNNCKFDKLFMIAITMWQNFPNNDSWGPYVTLHAVFVPHPGLGGEMIQCIRSLYKKTVYVQLTLAIQLDMFHNIS